MITIDKKGLNIHIELNDPQQKKDELICAIAAAIRWFANYDSEYKGDRFNLMVLAQLLEDLTNPA